MRCLLEAESPLSLVLDIFKNVKKKDKSKVKDNKYLGGSVSEYTKNLVMTFPTLCDNSLRPETASMISKANERNVVAMLQMLFASMQLKGTNGAEILGKLHKNISSMSIDDAIDALDTIASKEGAFFESAKGQATIRDMIKVVNEQAKLPDKMYPESSFSENSLMSYLVTKDYKGDNTIKKINEAKSDKYTLDDEAEADFTKIPLDQNSIARGEFNKLLDPKGQIDIAQYNQNTRLNRARAIQLTQQLNKGEEDREYAANRDTREAEKHGWEKEDRETRNAQAKAREEREARQAATLAYKDQLDSITKQLLDSDIKKANELAPSLMIVKYSELDTDGKIYDQKAFVAGVKSRLIAVDPAERIERLVAKNKTKVSFLNFVRATTGEISFIKDFLLCVKQAKIDAKNAVKKGPVAKMWKALENRSTKNAFNKMKKSGNDASAITTLVINQETANLMKKEFEFDIENVRNAKMIMDTYNLLGLIICDESIEAVKSLYAGNDTFETQAYSVLEREDKDKSYKKVINLMGQINR